MEKLIFPDETKEADDTKTLSPHAGEAKKNGRGTEDFSEDMRSATDILRNVEQQFLQLHNAMTAGLSAGWQGDAFDAHCEAEKELFRDATDAAGRLKIILRNDPPEGSLRQER